MTEPTTERDDRQIRGTQLSISHLMVITIGASVLCAVLATVLRQLPEEQQMKGTLFILAMIFVCAAGLVLCYYFRSIAEKQAGPSNFKTKAPLSSWFHIFGISSCVFALVVMAAGLWSITGTEKTSDLFQIWEIAYFVCMSGGYAGYYLINAVLWKTNPKSIDVRQNGIIFGTFLFVSWPKIDGFRWNKFSQKLMTSINGRFFESKVPKSQQARLEAELEKFIPKMEGLS